MKLVSAEQKEAYIKAANALKGGHRRQFMARIVNSLGYGGQSWAERELGWTRPTIRSGQRELVAGIEPRPNPGGPGRPRAEVALPRLLDDLKMLADGQSQTDPTFRTTRLYTRLSARAARQALIDQFSYTDEELPIEDVIRYKLNQLGYHLRAVRKSQPKKKLPETDDIFEQLKRVHQAAALHKEILRISLDAKATIKLGSFSRKGQSRVEIKALDHDFSKEKVHLFGLYLTAFKEPHFFFLPETPSLTADAMVDCLEQFWEENRSRFSQVKTLLLNLDNGPENNSYRRQFIQRMVDFSDATGLYIKLAYYPPYHSKYNPIERVWGVLEQHWNGSLLDELDTVLEMAKTMTYNKVSPIINLIKKSYEKGVTLTKKAMNTLEKRLDRLDGLKKYFVNISPRPVGGE